jgi:diguanylate cyclase (GGDEF)-like protein/PAS domain S-box-containing protein
MNSEKIKGVWFAGSLFYVITYYIWLILWHGSEFTLTLVGNIFSVAGPFAASFWLLRAAKRNAWEEKLFWLFLFLGSLSYVVAEAIWTYDENYLGMEGPFPGYADLFYMLQPAFYLAAFAYKLMMKKKLYQNVKLLLNVSIVITVASTFGGHLLLKPLLEDTEVSAAERVVSLIYPVADLVLVMLAAIVYFGPYKLLLNKTPLLIMTGLLIQSAGDVFFLYLTVQGKYLSGSLIDPLFTLSVLIMGMSGMFSENVPSTGPAADKEKPLRNGMDLLKLLIPYLSVVLLYAVMLLNYGSRNGLIVGAGISILLIIIRQVLITIEHHSLLRRFLAKTVELEESEQRYRSLFHHHPDAVGSMDEEGRLISVNPAYSKLTGFREEELIGRTLFSMIGAEERQEVKEHFAMAQSGKPQSFEASLFKKLGDRVLISFTSIPIMVREQVVGIYAISKDITEHRRNEKRVRWLAYHDLLTGAANRVLFEQQLKLALENARQTETMVAVMFIDLDGFKLVNDTMGHDAGDRLLIAAAQRLMSCLGEEDLVGRMGGDEFTLLISNITHVKEATRVAERLLGRLNEPYLMDELEVYATPSIGIAMYPGDAEDTASLMKCADTAMYRVKQEGKNHFQLYSKDMAEHVLYGASIMKTDLIQAVRLKDQFMIYYQPLVEGGTGSIIGVEALLRWKHPVRGVISPMEFIPAAEESGLIFPITEWVLRSACRQAKIWSDAGYRIRTGVNLSPHLFHHENLVDMIGSVLTECGLEPGLLDLEITEGIAIQDTELVTQKLRALRELGIRISADDFGTGYCSLAYLTRLPLDTLKVDRLFISGIGQHESSEVILTSVMTLAEQLNMNVVAEGVETEEQRRFLKMAGCSYMQGYLFGKPVPVWEMNSLLETSLGNN